MHQNLRTWKLFTFIMALVAGNASAEEPAALPKLLKKLSEKQPVKIVCFGDSVTGIYYHTGGRRAYPELLPLALQQVYPQVQISIVNAGISGHSTVNALARIKKDVLDHQPDLVTVMFGLNDMVRLPLPDFQKNLTQIVEQCRGAGAEVLLCTTNGVIDNSGRPASKLLLYNDAMKEVGKLLNVPVCDCTSAYDRFKTKDPLAWRLLFSDEIHPNMDGHKLNAVEICRTITGKDVSLADAGPPQPAMPRTLAKLKAGEPIRILAMEPFDTLIGPALKTVAPDAKVEVTTFGTANQTLVQLEQSAKAIRTASPKYDLVLVAVPLGVTPSAESPPEEGIRLYTWILNYALSFGTQEWDVVGIAPSVLKANLSIKEMPQDKFARHLIRAQDLTLIARPDEDVSTPQQILETLLKKNLKP